MRERHKQVYDLCKTYMSSRDVANALGISFDQAQRVTKLLKKKGHLELVREWDGKKFLYRYIQPAARERKQNGSYQPVGMCIMGVWM